MPINSQPVIRLEGVVRTFGAVRALDGIDISLPAGELVALIGANGSGKSTLLKILLGILSADSGRVEVLGLDPRRNRAALSTLVGYAGQDVALDPEITGIETLQLFHALRGHPGVDRERKISAIVEDFGLENFGERLVGGYSGGQRQRLHLALELMHEPQLLILDEPTTSLDPSGRRGLWDRLAAWRDAGHTVLLTTHDLPDVTTYCDRVVLLRNGKLLANDHPQALIARNSRAGTVITLSRPVADHEAVRRALEMLPGSPEIAIEGFTVTVWRNSHPEINEPALDILASLGMAVNRFERIEPNLANAYFRLGGAPLEQTRRPGGGGRGRNRRS
ncbi:MAG: ABC transporter ATP-binding protein [Candidatus Kapaibacterium sp.]